MKEYKTKLQLYLLKLDFLVSITNHMLIRYAYKGNSLHQDLYFLRHYLTRWCFLKFVENHHSSVVKVLACEQPVMSLNPPGVFVHIC